MNAMFRYISDTCGARHKRGECVQRADFLPLRAATKRATPCASHRRRTTRQSLNLKGCSSRCRKKYKNSRSEMMHQSACVDPVQSIPAEQDANKRSSERLAAGRFEASCGMGSGTHQQRVVELGVLAEHVVGAGESSSRAHVASEFATLHQRQRQAAGRDRDADVLAGGAASVDPAVLDEVDVRLPLERDALPVLVLRSAGPAASVKRVAGRGQIYAPPPRGLTSWYAGPSSSLVTSALTAEVSKQLHSSVSSIGSERGRKDRSGEAAGGRGCPLPCV